MEDYKQMYLELFNAITDSIEILKQAQTATEEMYIASGEPKTTNEDRSALPIIKTLCGVNNSKLLFP